MRPARIHPPTRPNTSRNVITMTAIGAKSRTRSPWLRTMKITPGCTPREREKYPTARSTAPASMRNAGVAECELEADAETGRLAIVSSVSTR